MRLVSPSSRATSSLRGRRISGGCLFQVDRAAAAAAAAAALEEWLAVLGNLPAYRGPFLLHYLEAVVYPDIPPKLLIAGAVAVCILNLWIYARRVRVRHSPG